MGYSCRRFKPNAEDMYQAFKRRLVEEGFAISAQGAEQISRTDAYQIELEEDRRQPLPGERWRHDGNRYFYEVIAIANEKSIKTKFRPTVVYKDVNDGRIWSSPLCRFLVRFTHEDDIVC